LSCTYIFYFYLLRVCAQRALPSFPTRRSSDRGRGRYSPVERKSGIVRFAFTANTISRIGIPIAFAQTHATPLPRLPVGTIAPIRSEEHTSELQSRENLVCRLLLEKKNNIN